MVRTINKTLTDNTSMERPPRVVELVGPAGAGKTTLSRALSQRNKRILAGVRPNIRRIGYIPFFVSNATLLLPTLLRLFRNGRWLTRQEIARMAILKGWHHALGRQVSNNSSVTILDQGPIFMLAMLHIHGPESLKSQSAEEWWESLYKPWASTLDMIIWVDAPDTILLERIHARSKWHLVKGESRQEANRLLERFRTCCEQIIAKLTANSGPKLLRFDTEQESLDQIVDKVLAAFNLEHSEGKTLRQ